MPNTFFHDLMLPVNTAKMVPEKDWKALEEYLELLLHILEHARESGMMPIILDINNLKVMYKKWLASEQTRWWMAAAEILPMNQPEEFLKYI
jgi:hypothetical protein